MNGSVGGGEMTAAASLSFCTRFVRIISKEKCGLSIAASMILDFGLGGCWAQGCLRATGTGVASLSSYSVSDEVMGCQRLPNNRRNLEASFLNHNCRFELTFSSGTFVSWDTPMKHLTPATSLAYNAEFSFHRGLLDDRSLIFPATFWPIALIHAVYTRP